MGVYLLRFSFNMKVGRDIFFSELGQGMTSCSWSVVLE